jgi:hypothetical protein
LIAIFIDNIARQFQNLCMRFQAANKLNELAQN